VVRWARGAKQSVEEEGGTTKRENENGETKVYTELLEVSKVAILAEMRRV
jgi:hypothetical protein